MGNFFSRSWFLEAAADILFRGAGVRPRTVEIEGHRFDALVRPDGSAADHPLIDFLEPRSPEVPPIGDVARVRALPRVALERVEATQATDIAGSTPAPCIDWRGFSSWEEFVAQASGRQWGAFKVTGRKRRKLARQLGPVTFEVGQRDHDLVELALVFKARQLRETRRLDRFASRRTRQLVHRLVEEGHLRLSVLRAGGRPLAFDLGHWGADRACCWINSFDPSQAEFSPGTQLLERLLEESWTRGHAAFDFLIGGEPYKYHYATHQRVVRPLGSPPLRQRLADEARRAIEADARPRRLRRAAYEVVRRAIQAGLSRQSPVPMDDGALRAAMETWAGDWPRARLADPGGCQLAALLDSAGVFAGAGRWVARNLGLTRSLARGQEAGETGALDWMPRATERFPGQIVAGETAPSRVRVRSRAAIEEQERVSPEPSGPRFVPETMAAFCGGTFPIRAAVRRVRVGGFGRSVQMREVYQLTGVDCPGAPLVASGACDRRCALLWRAAWLEPAEP